MKFMLSLLAFGCVALALAAPSLPVHPGGIGGLFRGPNSETIIRGPDGSVITSAAEGGQVHTNLQPIVVAEPVLVEGAAPVIEAVAVPAPVLENVQSSDLIGPSGRIATHGAHSVVAGPASTTITGPAVVADTIIRGSPVAASSVLNFAPPTISSAGIPLSVTPTPFSPIVAGISPISVTASPIATVTAASPVATVTAAELGRTALVSYGTPLSVAAPSIATVTATPPVATVTAIPQVSVTATASVLPYGSAASASGGTGASVTATASPNLATAKVEAVTAAPVVVPLVTNGGHGLLGVNDRPQLQPDQIAIDHRQLFLNPALIPSGNIIPPEVPVTPRIPIGRLRPTPGTLLTTPGLGAVANSNNIQRGEADSALSVTPNTLQVTPQTSDIITLQGQQALLQNHIQHAQTLTPNIYRNGVSLGVTPNSFKINPQINFSPEQLLVLQNGAQNAAPSLQEHATLSATQNSLELDPQITLSPGQVAALQNQQILLDDQVRRAQQATSSGILQPNQIPIEGPRNPVLFTPNVAGNAENIHQESLLSEELARSGVDASQLQLTSIPLSAVSGLPSGTLRQGGINDGLGGDAWGRYGRDTEAEQKEKKKEKSR